jgi:hypothetical protein
MVKNYNLSELSKKHDDRVAKHKDAELLNMVIVDLKGFKDGSYEDAFSDMSNCASNIYKDDLINWLKDNVDSFDKYMTEYIEFGVEEFDLLHYIGMAQIDYFMDLIYENLDDILMLYVYDFIELELGIKKITELQNDKIIYIKNTYNELEEIRKNVMEVLKVNE